MNESVVLLLLRHLFDEWVITRDRAGTWRAAGRLLLSSSDLDGLIEMLAAADPDAARQAVRRLSKRSPVG